jgi:hypothetical protein
VPPRDTSEEATRVQRSVYARLGPSRRVELAFDLSEQTRAIAIQGIRDRHPELSADDARHVLLRHLLGDALFEAAWPTHRPS